MTRINTDFSKDLKTGDLIIASLGNILWLGFYLGKGQGSSIQFYTFHQLLRWKNESKRKSPYKEYTMGNYTHYRIAKYHHDLIADGETKRQFYECVEILKSLNIIKE